MRKIFTIAILALSINAFAQTICTDDTIISIANLPSARNDSRAILNNSDFYIFGGSNGTGMMNVASKYSTTLNSWSNLTNMPTARAEMGVAEVNGVVYCIGGWTGSPSNKNEAYTISTNSWQTMANLPVAITSCDAATYNNKVYILGGTLGTTVTYFYEYNPQTNSYTALANPSQNRSQSSLVVYNNKIYLVGGYYYNGSYNSSNKLDEYDPSTNTWTNLANMPVAIQKAGITLYDNKIYVFGGSTTTPTLTPLNTFYVYDFTSNTWTAMNNLPFSIHGLEAKTYNNVVYLFGGNNSSITDLCYKYYCQFCTDTIITATQTIFVSDANFQSISPKTYFEGIDSLTTTIGGCDSIVNRYTEYVFSANYCTDTIHITVTDTLMINANLVSINPLIYQNTIKIYPNPTSDHITIDFGSNYATMNGYTLKITSSLSQIVHTTPINTQSTSVDLSTWTGNGIYFVHLIDASSNTIDIRKIVLQ